MERLAPHQAQDREAESAQGAVAAERFLRVTAAGGLEAAEAAHDRREDEAVGTNAQQQEPGRAAGPRGGRRVGAAGLGIHDPPRPACYSVSPCTGSSPDPPPRA